MPPTELAQYLRRNLDHLAGALLGAERVVNTIGQLARALPEHDELNDEEAANLAEALARVRAIREVHGPSERALVVELMLLGKLGRFDEAVEVGRAAYVAAPTWSSATALANALRRSGDVTASIEFFWAASRHDPTDVTALLEVGDIKLEQGNWGPALKAYEAALVREPEHPWAHPSSFYCRWRLTGDILWMTHLRRIAEQDPDTCGVAGALQQIVGGYTADNARARAAHLLGRAG